MDRTIINWMKKKHVPGFAACIVKGDRIVWSNGYGMANMTMGVPFTVDQTLFQIASISKTITATAIMQLRDKGQLNLDNDVNTFLNFPVRNPKHGDQPITFRHLLEHSSSIRDSNAIYSLYTAGDPITSLEEVVHQYFTPAGSLWKGKNFSKSAPDTKHRYSNMGFALLGYLVEVISKQTLEDYLQLNIYRPLEMNETSFYIANLDHRKQACAYTYMKKAKRKLCPGDGDGNLLPEGIAPQVGYNEHALYNYPTLADGMVRTSVTQLANFMIAMMNEGKFKTTQLLKNETVNEMLTGKEHGLGWFRDGEYWGHDGGDPGCSTEMLFNTRTKAGIIIFANANVELAKMKAVLKTKAENFTTQPNI